MSSDMDTNAALAPLGTDTPADVMRDMFNVAFIPLTRGKFATIDASDLAVAGNSKWQARLTDSGVWYAHRRPKKHDPHITMHRLILDASPNECVDHRDGNGLNNRKHNLRRCTRQQNGWNRKPNRRSATGLKGIYYVKRAGKWSAQIRFNGQPVYLGHHATAEDAARAYDREAVKLFGEFARTNFPTPEPTRL